MKLSKKGNQLRSKEQIQKCIESTKWITGSDDQINTPSELDEITHLHLQYLDVFVFSQFQKYLPNLQQLTLYLSHHIQLEAIQIITSNLSYLYSFTLKPGFVSSPSKQLFDVVGYIHAISGNLRSLQRLDLSDIKMTKQITSAFNSQLRLINILLLRRCELNRLYIRCIVESMPKLKHLDLSDNPLIDDAAAMIISKLVHLEKLQINGTGIGNSGSFYIAKVKKLREIHITISSKQPIGALKIVRNKKPKAIIHSTISSNHEAKKLSSTLHPFKCQYYKPPGSTQKT